MHGDPAGLALSAAGPGVLEAVGDLAELGVGVEGEGGGAGEAALPIVAGTADDITSTA